MKLINLQFHENELTDVPLNKQVKEELSNSVSEL